MPEYDNTNRGIFFINDRKEKENQPDYKGSINVDGKEYWISGWDKETKAGTAISLSVQTKDVVSRDQKDIVADVMNEPFAIGDIPF